MRLRKKFCGFLGGWIALVLSFSLVACGGGGGGAGSSSGSSSGSGSSTSTASSIEVLSSANSLLSGDATGITISAVLKDKSNNVLTSQNVAFSASSGNLSSVSATTGTNGRATAVLVAGSDRSNRDITVTVSSGSISGKVVVPVTGTALSFAGALSLKVGDSATYSVSLKDSVGSGLNGKRTPARCRQFGLPPARLLGIQEFLAMKVYGVIGIFQRMTRKNEHHSF